MARLYEFEPGEPRSYTDDYLTKVDVRVFFGASDWKDYTSELDETVAAKHMGKCPTHWPVLCATAFLNGAWVHEFMELRQLRDYFVGLVDWKRRGPSLEKICERLTKQDKMAMAAKEKDVEELIEEAPLPRITLEGE